MTPTTAEPQPTTAEPQNENNHSVAWLAAAVGAGIGIAALAYGRRRRSRWDVARDRASDLLQTAQKEMKPWMGAAVGTAAATAGLAMYLRKPKQSAWQRAGKRAADVASHARTQATSPWANVATAAAISLASLAYARNAKRRTIRGIDANTAERINTLAEKGLQLLRRARDISEQTSKLAARGRRAMA